MFVFMGCLLLFLLILFYWCDLSGRFSSSCCWRVNKSLWINKMPKHWAGFDGVLGQWILCLRFFIKLGKRLFISFFFFSPQSFKGLFEHGCFIAHHFDINSWLWVFHPFCCLMVIFLIIYNNLGMKSIHI